MFSNDLQEPHKLLVFHSTLHTNVQEHYNLLLHQFESCHEHKHNRLETLLDTTPP